VGKLVLIVLCLTLAVPVAATAGPARGDIIAILISCKTPAQQPGKPKPRTCSGSGTTQVGSGKVAWKLSLQFASKALSGTLALGSGADSVTLAISLNVAAGDVNGDGFSGTGAYAAQAGQGALKTRFADAASKQLRFVATRVSTVLTLRFTFTGVG